MASPTDVTGIMMPMLRAEPGVMNLTMLPGAASHPDGDAVHFDVLHGAADGAMVVGPECGILSLGFGLMRRDATRVRRSTAPPAGLLAPPPSMQTTGG